MRAIGMTRSQTRSMVRLEAAIVSLFGALLGIVVGLFFGWLAVVAMPESIIDTLAIPYLTLAVYAAVATVAGRPLLYKLWPAVLVLAFLVPVPGVFRQQLAMPLQEYTAAAAQFAFELLGLGVKRQGNLQQFVALLRNGLNKQRRARVVAQGRSKL